MEVAQQLPFFRKFDRNSVADGTPKKAKNNQNEINIYKRLNLTNSRQKYYFWFKTINME